MVLENAVLILFYINICVLFQLLTMPDCSVMLPVFYLPSEDIQTGTIIFSWRRSKPTEVISDILIYVAKWVFNGIWKTSKIFFLIIRNTHTRTLPHTPQPSYHSYNRLSLCTASTAEMLKHSDLAFYFLFNFHSRNNYSCLSLILSNCSMASIP